MSLKLIIDDKVISEELISNNFCCDIKACKGGCCVEGEGGAPLNKEETIILEDILKDIKPYMSERGLIALAANGSSLQDKFGDYETPLVNLEECIYVYFDKGIAKCAIEKAWEEGKIEFRKPISCQLYPIRVHFKDQFEYLEYNRWHLCESACSLGNKENLPIYKFLKESIIRAYGEEFYYTLDNYATEFLADQKG